MSVSVVSVGSAADNENDSESDSEPVMADGEGEDYSVAGGDADAMDESGTGTDEEIRRIALEQMRHIAEEFELLKERLYQERMEKYDEEIAAINAKTFPDYLSRIKALEEEREQRVETLGLYARLQLESLETSLHWEAHLADRMLDAQRKDVRVKLMDALVERKRRLELLHQQSERFEAELHERWQQRVAVGIKPSKPAKRAGAGAGAGAVAGGGAAMGMGMGMGYHAGGLVADMQGKSERKKFKAMLVEWPFIIYQLRDTEIQEDLAAIKRAVKSTRRPQPKSSERDIDVYFEDGKLFYDKRWYERGQGIYVENRDQVHYSGTITTINTGEVWVQKTDGMKVKLYVSQLRLGKFTIRPKRE